MNLLDKNAALIFSERVAFGEHKENEYKPGLGILLPRLARSGIKVGVVATTDRQKRLIDELNRGKPENELIAHATNIETLTSILSLPRFYYFKLEGDPHTSDRSVYTRTITWDIVERIINALGRVVSITEERLLDNLHKAARKFAEAA